MKWLQKIREWFDNTFDAETYFNVTEIIWRAKALLFLKILKRVLTSWQTCAIIRMVEEAHELDKTN